MGKFYTRFRMAIHRVLLGTIAGVAGFCIIYGVYCVGRSIIVVLSAD